MKKDIKYLLVELAKDTNMTLDFVAAAQKILEEDFKEEVLAVFKYDIIASAEGVVDFNSICAFIRYTYCLDLQKEFLDSNWDRIDEIYEIVRSEVQKQKEEKNDIKEKSK